MADLHYRRWASHPPTSMVDLCGCFEDMWTARDFAMALSAEYEKATPDWTVMDALGVAAIVRYSRCFVSGVRFRLDPGENATLSPEQRSLHQRVREVRDWHISHPVNLQEAYSLTVGCVDDGSGKLRTTVVSTHGRQNAPLDSEEVRLFVELLNSWIAWLKAAMDAEAARLLPYAQQLTPNQLVELPLGPLEPNSNPKARRPQARK